MKKEIVLTVTLTVSDEIDMDNNKIEAELIGNVLDALVSHANTGGLIPDQCEAFTETLSVEHDGSGISFDLVSNSHI